MYIKSPLIVFADQDPHDDFSIHMKKGLGLDGLVLVAIAHCCKATLAMTASGFSAINQGIAAATKRIRSNTRTGWRICNAQMI